jgi:hypothetical protein
LRARRTLRAARPEASSWALAAARHSIRPVSSHSGLLPPACAANPLHRQVEMLAHQHPRMHPPAEAATGPLHQIQPAVALLVVFKHRLATVAARHHVVNRSRRLAAQGSCHEPTKTTSASAVIAC